MAIPQNEEEPNIETDEKLTYDIGKQYEERFKRKPTAEKIAIENNISKATVERAEQYAKAVDNVAKNQMPTPQDAPGCDIILNRHEHLNHTVKTSPYALF